MKKMLLVIDLQKSFINPNTEFLISKIDSLVNSGSYDLVVFTKFINDNDSMWVKKLNYKGCISLEDRKIMIDTKDNIVLKKSLYTAYSDNLINLINLFKIDEVHLCGIDTECCVLKTAFDLFENGYNIKVLSGYSACTHGEESNKNALDIIARNIGKSNVI